MKERTQKRPVNRPSSTEEEKKISLLLDARTLAKLDERAEAEFMDRSKYIRRLLEMHLNPKPEAIAAA